MKYFIYFFAFILASCVGSKGIFNYDPKQPTGFSCGNPFSFTVQILTSPIIKNQVAQFKIIAQGKCGIFKEHITPAIFTGTTVFNKTFTVVGAQDFLVQVDALDYDQVTVLETQTKTVSVTVQDDGGNNPPPTPPTCEISKVASIVQAGANGIIKVDVTGAHTGLTLNNVPITAGQNYQVAPVFPGGNFYNMFADAVNAQGQHGYCSLSFLTPAQVLRVVSAAWDLVKIEMALYGPYTHLFFDGVQQTPPASGNLKIVDIVPTSYGNKTGVGRIVNTDPPVWDDEDTENINYCVPRRPFSIGGDTNVSYCYSNDYIRIPDSEPAVVAGIRHISGNQNYCGAQSRITVVKRNTNPMIKTSDVVTKDFDCDANGEQRVVVGFPQGSINTPYCAALLPDLEIYAKYNTQVDWPVGQPYGIFTCDPDFVMIGSEKKVGESFRRVTCGKIRWKTNCP